MSTFFFKKVENFVENYWPIQFGFDEVSILFSITDLDQPYTKF